MTEGKTIVDYLKKYKRESIRVSEHMSAINIDTYDDVNKNIDRGENDGENYVFSKDNVPKQNIE